MENKTARIDSLQAVRALAFIGIFLVHAKIAWGWSRLGVSIFFCMSGFLMTYIYWDRQLPGNIVDALRFSLGKIKKLYPLHIITMIAVVLIELWIYRTNGVLREAIPGLLRNIALNIFLVQSWYPDSTVNVALNGVAWYLSVALFLYIKFPFLLKWMKKRKLPVLVFTAILLIALQIILAYPFALRYGAEGVRYRWFMYCFPAYRVVDFFCGCVLGRIYMLASEEENTDNTIVYTILEICLLAFSIWFSLWLGTVEENPVMLAIKNWSSGYIVMALPWIWVFAMKKGLLTKLISNPAMIALGNISPQAFLIHYVIVRFVNAYMGLHQIPFTTVHTWELFVLEFIVTILACVIYLRIKKSRLFS